jgi:acetolactate synthase-1/2/3 large subunit
VGSTPGSWVTLPEISKIAGAYGLRYLRCENRREMRERIREALGSEGPVICEVMGQTNQRILPSVPSYMLPDGTMKSKALHEMTPEIGANFIELRASVERVPPINGNPGIVEG